MQVHYRVAYHHLCTLPLTGDALSCAGVGIEGMMDIFVLDLWQTHGVIQNVDLWVAESPDKYASIRF